MCAGVKLTLETKDETNAKLDGQILNVVCNELGRRQFKVLITSEKSFRFVVITFTVKVVDCGLENLQPRQEVFEYVVTDVDSVVLIKGNFIGNLFSDLVET